MAASTVRSRSSGRLNVACGTWRRKATMSRFLNEEIIDNVEGVLETIRRFL